MSWDRCTERIKEMMTDRGHTEWLDIEPISICSTKDHKSHVMVYMCHTDKFNIEGVKYAVYQLQQHRLKNVIIVYQNIITSSARKAIEHLQDYTIEMFEKKELQFNPTKHRLYSQHTKINKEEIQTEIPLDQVNQLPVLLRTDVISRYFHFNRGDVIKINRKNGSIAYRIVK
jgi:DNA-directed RNA polymerase I, II, and III subunit RPABC1